MRVGEVRFNASSCSLEIVVSIEVRGRTGACSLEAVVDTGFSEYLTLPKQLVNDLGLIFRTSTIVDTAGGSPEVEVYEGQLVFAGETILVDVYQVEREPLLGMSALMGYRLDVQVTAGGEVLAIELAE